MGILDIKEIISLIHEKCEDSLAKRKLEEKIRFILCHYSVPKEQSSILASSILNILEKAKDYSLIYCKIKQELYIVDCISDNTVDAICKYILDNILLSINPDAWGLYYAEKQEKGRREVKNYLKDRLDLIGKNIDKIIDIIAPKLYTLDEYEAKITKEWGDETFHINLDFFDFGNASFKDELNKALARGDKFIYIKGPTKDQALYAVLLELKYSVYKDHVFIGQSKKFFEHSELFNIPENIYVVDYDTAEESIPNGSKGTFIIPISQDIEVSGNYQPYVIEIESWKPSIFYRNLCDADYKDGTSYFEKKGESWDVFKKNFYHGKNYKQDFVDRNDNNLDIIKKLVLVGKFEYKKSLKGYKTDVDYLRDYLSFKDRDDIITKIKKYSKEENKILEATKNIYSAPFDKVRVVKNDNYNEVLQVLTQSDINEFFEFSVKILYAYEAKGTNRELRKYLNDGPSDDLFHGILSTWVDLRRDWKEESSEFVNRAISILNYSVIAMNSFSLALIAPSLIEGYIREFFKNAREKEVSTLRFFWFQIDKALKYIVNYADSEKVIYFLWDETRPVFKEKGQGDLVSEFIIKQINPWYDSVLLQKDKFIQFIEHMDDESIFNVLFTYIAYKTSWYLLEVESIDSSLSKENENRIKIENSERAKLIKYCFDHVFRLGSREPQKIIKILSDTYALNYSYSFSKIDILLQNFNSFSDVDKVSIEITLRRRCEDFRKNGTLNNVTNWTENFIGKIEYEKKSAKYLWLFSSSCSELAPFSEKRKNYRLWDDHDTRCEIIMRHLDGGFNKDVILELLNSFEIKDMEAFIRISLNYFGSSYDSKFFTAVSNKSPNAYVYIDALLEHDNMVEDFISVLLEDLCNNEESENFHYNYAAALTYLPFKTAREYVNICKNTKVRKRFFELLRVGNLRNEKLSDDDLELLISDMLEYKDFEDAIVFLDYNWESFPIEANMRYLVTIFKSKVSPVNTHPYFDVKLFKKITENIAGDDEKIELFKDIEYYFLGRDLFESDDSIFVSYFYSHPKFAAALIKADIYHTGYGIYSYDDAALIISSIKKFNPPDYTKFISGFLESLKEDEIAYDIGNAFISGLILKAPKMEGYVYVPCTEISDILDSSNDLVRSFGFEIYNEGNCHSGDGVIFLEGKANILFKEAESIKGKYSKIAAALHYAAQLYKTDANDERIRERYE